MSAPVAIPRALWAAACAEFARRHRGWLVQLHTQDARTVPAGGAPSGAQRPLRELVFTERGLDNELRIVLGEGAEQAVRRIPNPRALYLERYADGGGADGVGNGSEAGLAIEEATGRWTLLRLRVAAAPETLDGIAPTEL